MDNITEIAKNAKISSTLIASAGTSLKNKILKTISENLILNAGSIIEENEKDITKSKESGISGSLLERLKLDHNKINKIAAGIEKIISLEDPVGEIIFGYNLPNGLILKNVRVPLGTIGIIYEARPDVTVDASILCLKAGNSVILRGSSHALATNKKLTQIMRQSLRKNNLPEDIIQIIPTDNREDAEKMMKLREYIDVLIPRGGKSLIDSVVQNSKIPVIETGIGNCHIYIDSILDGILTDTIIKIIVNAKTQRPAVCNALEKLLIHESIAEKFLPVILKALNEKNVIVKGCGKVKTIFPSTLEASEDDWYEEYLDLKIAIKIVENIDQAILHINKYGSGHSDAIITSNYKNAAYFTNLVNSSAVYVNASTRFTDGGEFGMGAEIGISTQKLHWRGPMGLKQLTTNKFIIYGNGQIRE